MVEKIVFDHKKLSRAREMWEHLRFEPWEHRGMEGVSRVITLVKGGMIGTIAKYHVYDHIVWQYSGVRDMDEIYKSWKPKQDVMTQRFLFVGGEDAPLRRIKSYWFGFAGYLEIYHYKPGGKYHAKIKDLIPPVDFALNAPTEAQN